jgi:hypothetical protein
MSALPKSMPADEVAREQADDHVVRVDLRVAPDMRTPFHVLVARMRASNVCPRCDKTRVLLDLSAPHVRVKTERPDPAVHCACPGGPCYTGTRFTEGAAVVAIARLQYFVGHSSALRYVEIGTHGVVRDLTGPYAAVVFDGHRQPYLQHSSRLEQIVELAPANDGGSL